MRLTFGFCDGYRPRRPDLHGPHPSVSSRRRPDPLSPCRGDLRLARAAFDRKPRLWPDCRFVAPAASAASLLLRTAGDPMRKSADGCGKASRACWFVTAAVCICPGAVLVLGHRGAVLGRRWDASGWPIAARLYRRPHRHPTVSGGGRRAGRGCASGGLPRAHDAREVAMYVLARLASIHA